jgi:Tfp pilus assembly protein PilO
MRFGPREIAFVVILLVIPVGAWWFVFRPHNAQNAEMRLEIEAKQEKLKALDRATGTIGNLKKEIAALSKALAFFESKLPSEKEIHNVLQEVWRLAEANRLIAKSIRTLDDKMASYTTATSIHREQPIAVKLEGDFRGLYAFLQALERQPRILRIHQMKLTKLNNAPQGYVNAELTISVFFEKEAS